MTHHEQLGESKPGQSDQPNDELYIARQSLFELIVTYARDELRHAHPLVKVAAELIDTERVKSPLPTGDGSTLPPKLREVVAAMG